MTLLVQLGLMKLEKCFFSTHFSWFGRQLIILHVAIWLLFLVVSRSAGQNASWMKLKSELLYVYVICDLILRLFAYSSSSPKKNYIKEFSIILLKDRLNWTHLSLTINLISTFCTKFQLFALKKISLSALLGINWRALSQWACWNFCRYIIKSKINCFC